MVCKNFFCVYHVFFCDVLFDFFVKKKVPPKMPGQGGVLRGGIMGFLVGPFFLPLDFVLLFSVKIIFFISLMKRSEKGIQDLWQILKKGDD